jgi:hypothetical protein
VDGAYREFFEARFARLERQLSTERRKKKS